FEGSHVVAAGFKADGCKATGPRAASFTVWRFGELTCFGDLPCRGALLAVCASRPASLTSIGRTAIAAIAAMMVRRRDRNPAAIPPRTQIYALCFMLASPEDNHSSSHGHAGRGRLHRFRVNRCQIGSHQFAFGCLPMSPCPGSGTLLQRQPHLVRIVQHRRELVQLRVAKALLFDRAHGREDVVAIVAGAAMALLHEAQLLRERETSGILHMTAVDHV